MRSDPMTKEGVLAVLDRSANLLPDKACCGNAQWSGSPNDVPECCGDPCDPQAELRQARATVEGLWEERERLQATLNNTLAERDAAEHVAQSSRISAIDAESRATRAEAAERDARRYRFLRELSEAKLPIIAAWGASGDAEYLDAAIDAALSGTVKQGEG
jgi:hypothetical protein